MRLQGRCAASKPTPTAEPGRWADNGPAKRRAIAYLPKQVVLVAPAARPFRTLALWRKGPEGPQRRQTPELRLEGTGLSTASRFDTTRTPPESRLEGTGVSPASRFDTTRKPARITVQRHPSFAGISIRHHRKTRQIQHSEAPEFRRRIGGTFGRKAPGIGQPSVGSGDSVSGSHTSL